VPERPAGSSAVRRAGAHRAPRSRGRALVLGLVLLLVAAVGGIAVLVSARGEDTTDGDPALDRVADWVVANLPDDTVLAAPADVRNGLVEAGLDEDRLSGEDDGTLSVITGDPPAGALVLARFEGDDGAIVSVVDPAPGRPTAAELDRSRRLADAVLANPLAAPSGRAADVLRAGDVDARLLGLLAGLVGRHDAHVADLPPAPGGTEGPPARHLVIDRVGDEPLTPGAPVTEELLAFLDAQRAPFAPDTVEVTDDGVLVGFDYVSAPDAVVTDATT
jgi:hypothetical protein